MSTSLPPVDPFAGFPPLAGPTADFPADFMRPSDVLSERPASGDRFETGFPTLDKACRGGIPAHTLVTIQGPPGAGKSSLAGHLAARFARQHRFRVVALLPDEGREAFSIRFGQNFGLDRALLEDGDPESLGKLAGIDSQFDVHLPDPDEELNSLEFVIAEARRFREMRDPENRPILFAVDSTQTVRTAAAEEIDSPRLLVKEIVRQLRAFKSTVPAVVLNVSQVNRGAYRNRKASENVTELAAGAESSALEFGSDLVLSLSGDPMSGDPVRVVIAKNRLGPKGVFFIRFDPRAATFEEVPQSAAEEQAVADQAVANTKRLHAIDARILGILHDNRELLPMTTNKVFSLVGGTRGEVGPSLNRLRKTASVLWCQGKNNSDLWSLPL